jgi:hypothetical protein
MRSMRPALIMRLSGQIIGTLCDGPRTTRQVVDIVSDGMELCDEDRRRLTVTVGTRLKEMRTDGRVTAGKGSDRKNVWALRTRIGD